MYIDSNFESTLCPSVEYPMHESSSIKLGIPRIFELGKDAIWRLKFLAQRVDAFLKLTSAFLNQIRVPRSKHDLFESNGQKAFFLLVSARRSNEI